ncbi:MAG: hypothetical protein KF773_18275 [Deltaproteobacteria bacterium]|nr:hypothetical protein [Deltaproteobacteria bacterium]
MRAVIITIAGALALCAACKDEGPRPDVPDAARADAAVDAPAACLDPQGSPAGCFRQETCEPEADLDFLNGCTDGSCVAYDNAARLPLYNNGTLPPLP